MQQSPQVSWRDFETEYVLVHWAGVVSKMAMEFEVVPAPIAKHVVERLITDGHASVIDNLLALEGNSRASSGGKDEAYARVVAEVGDQSNGKLVLYRKKPDTGSTTPPSKLPPDDQQKKNAPQSDRAKVIAKVRTYDTFIAEASQIYGIGADQIRAIIATESRGKPEATSGAAFGLMQITKDTWKGTCANHPELKKFDFDRGWTDPRTNILVGTAVFQGKLKTIGVKQDDPDFARLAIVAYNAGEGTVKRAIKHAQDAKCEHPTAECLKPEHLKPAIKETKIYSYYLTGNGKKNNKSGSLEEAIELKYKEVSHYPSVVQGYLDELKKQATTVAQNKEGSDTKNEEDEQPLTTTTATTVVAVASNSGGGSSVGPGDVIDGHVIYAKEVRAGGTIAWRNNNPGNIRTGKFAESHGAFKGKKNKGFAIFPTHDVGFAAIVALLKTDAYRPLTVVQCMQKYAPASDNNDPAAYAAKVSKSTGLPPNRILGSMSEDDLKKFALAIERVEGWKAGTVYTWTDTRLPVAVKNALAAAPTTTSTTTNNNAGTNNQSTPQQKGGDFDWGQLAAWIALNEGRKNKVYIDTKGHPTIGIGFNLDREGARAELKGLGLDYDAVKGGRVTLTEAQIDALFRSDVSGALMSARSVLGGDTFDSLSPGRKIVVIDMVFNLGSAGFAAFKKTIAAIRGAEYETAANEMVDSSWYKQVGDRAKRNVAAMRTGVLPGGTTQSTTVQSTTTTNNPAVVQQTNTNNKPAGTLTLSPVTQNDTPPAGYSYHSLDKDPTYGSEFKFDWVAGDYLDKAKRKRAITIKTPNWAKNNIISFKIADVPKLGTMTMHKRIAPQFRAWFLAAVRRGLGDKILANGGTYVPRTMTNQETKLSNHALGSAIDINVAQNGWDCVPAARGKTGSVRELADFCADFGLFWGGWYKGTKDGMHFEAVQILSEDAMRASCLKHGLDYEVVKKGGTIAEMSGVSSNTTTIVANTSTTTTTTTNTNTNTNNTNTTPVSTTPTGPITAPTYQEISRDFSVKIPGSQYFTWHEALWLPSDRRHANATEVSSTIIKNIIKQAQALDKVRAYFGQPISVHCWLRPPEYNAKIGGAKNSAHLRGMATDFHMSVYTAQQVRQVLVHDKSLYPGAGELDVSWVHLDLEHQQWFWPKGGLLTDVSKVPKPDFPLPKQKPAQTTTTNTNAAVIPTNTTTPKPTTTQQSSNTVPQIGGPEASWVTIARGELGQHEVAGGQNNARIVEYHSTTTLKAKDDETAWCSSFVNWCMTKAGVAGTKSAAAASWVDWGSACEPRLGAVVVLYNAKAANSSTTTTGNHVAFLIEETSTTYKLLGGNQGDQVSIVGFSKTGWKIKACRWPNNVPFPTASPGNGNNSNGNSNATKPANTTQTSQSQVQQKLPAAQELVAKYASWYDTDEAGLAEAVYSRGGDGGMVAAVFHVLRQDYNSDADDVAYEYVTRVQNRGGAPRDLLAKDTGIRDYLIETLGEGWVSSEEAAAINYLRTLKPPSSNTNNSSSNSGSTTVVAGGAQNVDWVSVTLKERQRYAIDVLVARYGYPVNGAAGLVGNLTAESGVMPSRIEGSSSATPMRAKNFAGKVTDFTAEEIINRSSAAERGPKLPGVGLAQWTSKGRRDGLFKHSYQGRTAGAPILKDMDAQLDYLVKELKESYKGVNKILTNPGVSVNDACDEVVYRFEVPGTVVGRARDDSQVQDTFKARRKYASDALQAYKDGPKSAPGTINAPTVAKTQTTNTNTNTTNNASSTTSTGGMKAGNPVLLKKYAPSNPTYVYQIEKRDVLVFVPPDAAKKAQPDVFVFLHGMGGDYTLNTTHAKSGTMQDNPAIAASIPTHAIETGVIAICPQTIERVNVLSEWRTLGESGTLKKILQETLVQLGRDLGRNGALVPQSVRVSGHSAGGGGIGWMAMAMPETVTDVTLQEAGYGFNSSLPSWNQVRLWLVTGKGTPKRLRSVSELNCTNPDHSNPETAAYSTRKAIAKGGALNIESVRTFLAGQGGDLAKYTVVETPGSQAADASGIMRLESGYQILRPGGAVQAIVRINRMINANDRHYEVCIKTMKMAMEAQGSPGPGGTTTTTTQTNTQNTTQNTNQGSTIKPGVPVVASTGPVTIKDQRPQAQFIARYAPGAIALEKADGVPALFTLGQGALESGWGKSSIGNALFGIKAGSNWTGMKQLVTTTEYFSDDKHGSGFPSVISITKVSDKKYKYIVKDWFRDYPTVEAGLADHSRFLMENKRYAPAFNTTTPDDFAQAVADAGYATAPDYGGTLKSMIATVKKYWPPELGAWPAGNCRAITGGKPGGGPGLAASSTTPKPNQTTNTQTTTNNSSNTTSSTVVPKTADAATVVEQYAHWYDFDQDGLAKVLYDRGDDATFVSAAIRTVASRYPDDADDVSFAYVQLVRSRGGGSLTMLKRDAALRQLLIQQLSGGWFSSDEIGAVTYLQTLGVTQTPQQQQGTNGTNGNTGGLAALMAKSRLTPEEIAKARPLIEQLPAAQKRANWLDLQAKTEYQNQRDNQGADEEKTGGTCNLTSLAMCLEYLGISNPHPGIQYDEALVKIANDNKYGDITYASTWEKVAKHCGAKMITIISGDQKVARTKWEKTVRDEHLAVGHSVLCSIVGHIVRVQAVDDQGIVVDNPYGLETIGAGTDHKWIRTNSGKNGWGAGNKSNEGEDNSWPWSDVESHTFRSILAFSK